MGLYDTITFKCPNCGENMDAQSKSGECVLNEYYSCDVPLDVACNANRHAPFECYSCGKEYKFKSRVKLTLEKIDGQAEA